MNVIEGMEFIINRMKQHKTNEEFFEGLKKTGATSSSNGNSSSSSDN